MLNINPDGQMSDNIIMSKNDLMIIKDLFTEHHKLLDQLIETASFEQLKIVGKSQDKIELLMNKLIL